MLAFPKNTMACDLAGRMAKIVDYMGKVRELVRDSMPSDGSACSSEPIDSSDVRELNSMFEEVHDKNFNKHVKDETMKGNEEYKEWFAQQKAEEREAKRAEKERLAAEKAERRQIMAE